MLNEIKSQYEKQTQAYYAAARLWTDAIIDPLETRKWISIGIDAANNAPIEKIQYGTYSGLINIESFYSL